MLLRAVPIVSAATVFLVASPAAPSSAQRAYTLRIESLSQHPPSVRVTTRNMGGERPKATQRDTLLAPPAGLPIADSIDRIHVVVLGFASVRVILANNSVPSDSIVSEGRDITLARKPGGRFERIWTVQPLLP